MRLIREELEGTLKFHTENRQKKYDRSRFSRPWRAKYVIDEVRGACIVLHVIKRIIYFSYRAYSLYKKENLLSYSSTYTNYCIV